MTKPILIIKIGETIPHLADRRGDFEDWIKACIQQASLSFTITAPYKSESLPSPQDYAGVIITGSHAMVTDKAEWSERTASWIRQVIKYEIPLLGICYGHQLLAHALGGVVGSCPIGVECGTVDIVLQEKATADPLFKLTPVSLKVHASHTQSVVQLPPGAITLASNANEPCHAFSVGSCAWGVQFHPEFDADIMNAYLNECADLIQLHGQNPSDLLLQTEKTPYSAAILDRFVEIIIKRSSPA